MLRTFSRSARLRADTGKDAKESPAMQPAVPHSKRKSLTRVLHTVVALAICAAFAPAPADAGERRVSVSKKERVAKSKRVSKSFVAKNRRSVVITRAARPSYGKLAGLHRTD